MKKIFLSASIPLPGYDSKYIDTMDISAIRDSINGLAKVVIPNINLIWGGHPSINPLIRIILERMDKEISKHIVLYQSNFFRNQFLKYNKEIETIIITKDIDNNKEKSLLYMRKRMIKENDFVAGIFIGGMSGVEWEFDYFKKIHPKALLLPIATTGAAAKVIYDRAPSNYSKELATDYSYMSLFIKFLKEII